MQFLYYACYSLLYEELALGTFSVFQMKFHNTMESVYKHIPQRFLPLEYLPDDYTGPSPGTVDQLNGKVIS